MAILTYSQAIRQTIEQEMKRDEKVFVMGEDVEKLGGVSLVSMYHVRQWCDNVYVGNSAFSGSLYGVDDQRVDDGRVDDGRVDDGRVDDRRVDG